MSGLSGYYAAREATERSGARQMQALDDMQSQRTRRQAGNALAGGDYEGAANALFQGGELQSGVTVQNAHLERQAADKEQQKTALLAVATGVRAVQGDPTVRRQHLNAIAPRLTAFGVTPEMIQSIRDEDLTDQGLDSIIAVMGGQQRSAPSGYRYRPDGSLEAIPGGPEDPKNQRWQVTPYGFMPPPGWEPSQQASAAPEYVDALPPGVRPRPNQAPSAAAAGGAERQQPVGVSFQSTDQARSAIAQIVPGVTFTSGRRTPEENTRVRGATNSNHLKGRAWDLVPPSGMSMGQLAAKMQQQGFRVLNEGDHVHVSW
jgi:hypothetical protein